jgi:site-specific recombinase XerD
MEDADLIRMWLHGRPATTRQAYTHCIDSLRDHLGTRPLGSAGLDDLQRWADGLSHRAPRTQARAIAAVKSFFQWHTRYGTLPSNPAAALRSPAIRNDLAERILSAEEVRQILAAAQSHRDRAALGLLYFAALRASELCGLRWRDLSPRSDGGANVAVFGKGGKSRTVVIPAAVYDSVIALRDASRKPTDLIFGFTRFALLGITKRTAARAGVPAERACNHAFRHSHASHAADAGCPLPIIRDTLGHASVATTQKYLHVRPGETSAKYLKAG